MRGREWGDHGHMKIPMMGAEMRLIKQLRQLAW